MPTVIEPPAFPTMLAERPSGKQNPNRGAGWPLVILLVAFLISVVYLLNKVSLSNHGTTTTFHTADLGEASVSPTNPGTTTTFRTADLGEAGASQSPAQADENLAADAATVAEMDASCRTNFPSDATPITSIVLNNIRLFMTAGSAWGAIRKASKGDKSENEIEIQRAVCSDGHNCIRSISYTTHNKLKIAAELSEAIDPGCSVVAGVVVRRPGPDPRDDEVIVNTLTKALGAPRQVLGGRVWGENGPQFVLNNDGQGSELRDPTADFKIAKFRLTAGAAKAEETAKVEEFAKPEEDRRAATTNPPSVMPDDEKAVVEAIEDARRAYKVAANDLARGGTRGQRKSALCHALKGKSVDDWTGTIETLSSNSEGKGVISIRIGPDIHVATWNNALSDIMHTTLIEPGTELFSRLSSLKVGDRVKFSGLFFESNTDCVFELSMTLGGSMGDPDFIMRFTAVAPL